MSPYGFATARAHYEALLAESRAKGGPTPYSRERLPPDWDGRYTNNVSLIFALMRAGKAPVLPKEFSEPPQWIIGYHNQLPTILSLLTPEYQQRLVQQLYHQAHDRAAQWSAMLCRPEGFMRWWSGPGGPGSLDVTVTPTRVQFLGGSGNAIRNVHVGRDFDLSGAVPRLGADVPRWMGESRGRFDGQTLVVDTTNFNGKAPVRGSDEQLHLVERFTRTGADTIAYEFTVDNATVWTRPWTVAFPLRRTDQPMYEYSCHEGNGWSMEGLLRAARTSERDRR